MRLGSPGHRINSSAILKSRQTYHDEYRAPKQPVGLLLGRTRQQRNAFHYFLWRIRFLFSRAYAGKLYRSMGKPSEALAVEVGCGSARTLHYPHQMIGAGDCVALDLSPIAIQIVRRVSPGFHAGVASAFDLPMVSGGFGSFETERYRDPRCFWQRLAWGWAQRALDVVSRRLATRF